MSTEFKDLFSHGSDDYSRYRPTYPPELFAWLSDQLPDATAVWDCGCGTGQASLLLAEQFPHVNATDPSAKQLENSAQHERIVYSIATAEASGLPDASVDLVMVAQALHWFDLDRFYAEVRRVLKPGGLLVVLTYNLLTIEGIDNGPLTDFHFDFLDGYWTPERAHVDNGYADLPFPFERLPVPDFPMTAEWSFEQLIGYVSTWSAVEKYRNRTGLDPMPDFTRQMADAWGDTSVGRWMVWPLTVKLAKDNYVGGVYEL
jgi:ubiquinone/menaquinone biosynthesis C-methylase UbiE